MWNKANILISKFRFFFIRKFHIVCSINCIRAAYLPNGERQREYTRIFGKAQDLNRQISERLDFLYAYREMRKGDGQNRGIPHVNGAAIAARAMLRWQDKWNNRPAV